MGRFCLQAGRTWVRIAPATVLWPFCGPFWAGCGPHLAALRGEDNLGHIVVIFGPRVARFWPTLGHAHTHETSQSRGRSPRLVHPARWSGCTSENCESEGPCQPHARHLRGLAERSQVLQGTAARLSGYAPIQKPRYTRIETYSLPKPSRAGIRTKAGNGLKSARTLHYGSVPGKRGG